jgi:glycosidase
MVWDKAKQNRELFGFYKTLNNIRKSNKCLIYGEFETLYKADNVIAYRRILKDEEVLVILNNSDEEQKLNLESIASDYLDLLNNNLEMKLENKVSLVPNDIKILKLK